MNIFFNILTTFLKSYTFNLIIIKSFIIKKINIDIKKCLRYYTFFAFSHYNFLHRVNRDIIELFQK